jgi:hypothetical protein
VPALLSPQPGLSHLLAFEQLLIFPCVNTALAGTNCLQPDVNCHLISEPRAKYGAITLDF